MQIIQNNQIVEITKVKCNDYNPKPDFNSTEELKAVFEKIKKSLELHGQIDPILVRELDDGTFEIINGFHRWSAANELGADKIEIKNLGKISRNDAIKKALSTEDIKVEIDEIEKAKLIKELVTEDDTLGLPYTDEEITNFVDLLEFDFDQFENEDNPTDIGGGSKEATCPKCGHKFTV